jgi:hypothetical protein
MAVNATPQYRKAEEEYRRAQSVDEQIRCLELMLQLLPKHKASEKVQADLKTKLKEARVEQQQERSAPKKEEPATEGADERQPRGRAVSVHHAGTGPGDDAVGRCDRAADRHAADHRQPVRAVPDEHLAFG